MLSRRFRAPLAWRRPLGLVLLGSTLLSSGCLDVDNQFGTPSQASVYLTYILNQMQAFSARRAAVDWQALRTSSMAHAKDAEEVEDVYPGITQALTLLGDGTSSFTTPTGAVLTGTLPACDAALTAPHTLPANIAYVKVDSFSRSGPPATAYANDLVNRIREADHEGIEGWIVDLRGNGARTLRLEGMWAMLAGLGPLLGEGLIGRTAPVGGGTTQAWEHHGGTITRNDEIMLTVTPYQLQSPGARIAVITDGTVARAGEAVTVAFRGRENARSFGGSTCGLPFMRTPFPMFDGGVLDLATGLMVDRTNNAYGAAIAPAQPVSDASQVIPQAVAWIQSAP